MNIIKAVSRRPILVEKIWGGSEIGKVFNNIKLPKGKPIGEWWVLCDKKCPIVIKIIDVKKPLSVQVHPFGKKGKTELWYILKAGKTAKVLGGIGLDEHKVKAGDWVYLPGGTVHTILPPALLLEVSQNKLITYRLYDWGRGTRPLDIEEGIKNINLDAKPLIYRNINKFNCEYFSIKLKKLRKGESFRIKGVCFVLEGAIQEGDNIIRKGEICSVNDKIKSLSYSEVFCVSWMTKSSKARF